MPADTEVTSQAPERPAALGHVAARGTARGTAAMLPMLFSLSHPGSHMPLLR